MQFLAYIVVLMVSVSTILLELHWLTSPSPQSKPAIQASAPAPRAKAEGPNPELSPVYPKSEAPRSAAPAATEPAPQAAAETAAKFEPQASQKPAETTGAATRPEGATQPTISSATFTSTIAPAQPASAAPANKCDVQSCASAYKSFRASDCTYQPMDGARRLCMKSPETGRKTASEQRGPNADTRRPSKDAELRDAKRAVQPMTDRNTADSELDMDSDLGPNLDDEPSRVIMIRRQRW